jgi:hypothetical protein
MIFKWKLQGYMTFLMQQVKVGAFAAAFLVIFFIVTNTSIPGMDKYDSALICAGIIFILGNIISIVVYIREFADRDDPFIFQGYFPLEIINKNVSDIIQLLEKMGYQTAESKYPGKTMKRVVWPGPSFCNNHLNFRPYLVNIQELNSGVKLRFFDPKFEYQFDGRQVAYKASQELLRRLNKEPKDS